MNREACIRVARVYLREARARSGAPAQRNFCFVLLRWAGQARRRAAEQEVQLDLFGVVSS